jgi:predicted ATP-dependent endonuclease of OLD family
MSPNTQVETLGLQSVRIQRFKRIKDAAIDLGAVNVFVGGNNSGKSSLIQGLHFGVGLLQTIALSGVWKASTSFQAPMKTFLSRTCKRWIGKLTHKTHSRS